MNHLPNPLPNHRHQHITKPEPSSCSAQPPRASSAAPRSPMCRPQASCRRRLILAHASASISLSPLSASSFSPTQNPAPLPQLQSTSCPVTVPLSISDVDSTFFPDRDADQSAVNPAHRQPVLSLTNVDPTPSHLSLSCSKESTDEKKMIERR
ncbi:hypothetical protein M0R45_026505 [Rubus argutus]|uniref:Uncharacterized protein n=1 Tax=Rubus argutus TaxID=59490 RepID=A0AAW1WZG9_RUBAR